MYYIYITCIIYISCRMCMQKIYVYILNTHNPPSNRELSTPSVIVPLNGQIYLLWGKTILVLSEIVGG